MLFPPLLTMIRNLRLEYKYLIFSYYFLYKSLNNQSLSNVHNKESIIWMHVEFLSVYIVCVALATRWRPFAVHSAYTLSLLSQ